MAHPRNIDLENDDIDFEESSEQEYEGEWEYEDQEETEDYVVDDDSEEERDDVEVEEEEESNDDDEGYDDEDEEGNDNDEEEDDEEDDDDEEEEENEDEEEEDEGHNNNLEQPVHLPVANFEQVNNHEIMEQDIPNSELEEQFPPNIIQEPLAGFQVLRELPDYHLWYDNGGGLHGPGGFNGAIGGFRPLPAKNKHLYKANYANIVRDIRRTQMSSAEIQGEANERKIYIGRLHPSIKERDLKEYFKQFGIIESLKLHIDRKTHKSRKFGFVVFTSPTVINTIMATDNHFINGHQLHIEKAGEPNKEQVIDNTQ